MELRSDIESAAQEMVARDRVKGELRELAEHLLTRERVRRLCSGTQATGHCLMAITNRRVIVLRVRQRGVVSSQLSVRRLAVVDWTPGLLAGTITVVDPGGRIELGNVELGEGAEIVRFLRSRVRRGQLVTMSQVPSLTPRPASLSAQSPRDAPTEVLARIPSRRRSVLTRGESAGLAIASAASLIALILGSHEPVPEAPVPEGVSKNALSPSPVTVPPANADRAVGVVKVIDADTVEVSGGAGGIVEVLGIVAPQAGQCGADIAQRFATNKLLGTTAILVADASQPSEDSRGRILAHLRLPGGADYALLATRAGVVKFHASGPPVSQADDIKAAQAEAERSDKGIWAPPCNGSFGPAATANPTGI